MLDFFQLKPHGDQEIGGVFVGQSSKSVRYTCLSYMDESESEDTKPIDNAMIVEVNQQGPFDVEYNECQRSYCGDNDDQDNGLDSTLSISILGDVSIKQRVRDIGD